MARRRRSDLSSVPEEYRGMPVQDVAWSKTLPDGTDWTIQRMPETGRFILMREGTVLHRDFSGSLDQAVGRMQELMSEWKEEQGKNRTLRKGLARRGKMGDRELRKAVIKLAHEKKGLRPHLLPLLKEAAEPKEAAKGPKEEETVQIEGVSVKVSVHEHGTQAWIVNKKGQPVAPVHTGKAKTMEEAKKAAKDTILRVRSQSKQAAGKVST